MLIRILNIFEIDTREAKQLSSVLPSESSNSIRNKWSRNELRGLYADDLQVSARWYVVLIEQIIARELQSIVLKQLPDLFEVTKDARRTHIAPLELSSRLNNVMELELIGRSGEMQRVSVSRYIH